MPEDADEEQQRKGRKTHCSGKEVQKGGVKKDLAARL